MAYSFPDGIRYAQGNLNSATILGMQTTGKILIAAPGAGLMHIVLSTFFNVKVGSTPWSTMGNIWLIYGTTGNDQVNTSSTFISNQVQAMSASTNYVFGGSYGGMGSDVFGGTTGNVSPVLSSNTINKAISITCVDPVTPGGANGNIDWKIWYMTIPAL